MNLTDNFAQITRWISKELHVPQSIGEGIVSFFIFAIFLIAGWIVYQIFQRYLSKWAKRTKTNLDDEILKNIKKPIYFFVILFGTFYALKNISVLSQFSNLITYGFIIAQILLGTFIVTRVVNVVMVWYAEKKSEGVSNHILFMFKKLINAFILIIGFLLILFALNIDLTGAVVGLGVGGIAIAFALQNVLSDVFSALSIYFDRPFEIGDFIIVGEHAGVVQQIGLKSTRVQLLQGEELVLSNRELTTTRIRNFKKMDRRRIEFSFGVTYGTSSEKLRKIPDMVKEIINNVDLAEADRVHFKEFGDFSLNFDVVYYINSKDYATYMDIQQKINLGIKEAFEKEGIEMAFPTQTIFLEK